MQTQVQRNDFKNQGHEHNVPESWKWENMDKIKEKKERKGKAKNRKKKNQKQNDQQEAE